MKKVLVIFTFILVIGIVYFLFFTDFMKADGCLDSGGCWDYQDKVCRKEEDNTQQLCDRASLYK